MTRHVVLMGAVAILAAALMSCKRVAGDSSEDTSYRQRPGYVIDSVRPIEVDLARFRENLGAPPAGLTGGGDTFDRLIGRFAAAVSMRDTVALRRMQVSAAEYAWLVYPSSPQIKPPYQQAPQIAWMLLRQSSDEGLARLVQRRGGTPLRIIGHSCDPNPVVEGENKFWRKCVVQTLDAGTNVTERLFGAVIERRGHFKFLSYQNQY
jgi:hypothetical protein